MQKSDKDRWTGFNMGRVLFVTKGLEEYDRFLARTFQTLLKGKKLAVEYGCGDGVWLEYLAANNPSRKLTGVEWNEPLYEYAVTVRQPGLENLEFICADMSKPEGIVECDVCWSLGGIEHFSDSVSVLREWVEKLTPDGLCFLTVPNLMNRHWIQRRHGISPDVYLGKDRVVTDSYGYAEIWSPNHFAMVAMEAGLEVMEMGEISCLKYEKPLYLKGLKRRNKLA